MSGWIVAGRTMEKIMIVAGGMLVLIVLAMAVAGAIEWIEAKFKRSRPSE